LYISVCLSQIKKKNITGNPVIYKLFFLQAMSIHQSPIPTIPQVQVRKRKLQKLRRKNIITVSPFKRVPFSNDYPVVKSLAAMF
jgi:hypothetical protein